VAGSVDGSRALDSVIAFAFVLWTAGAAPAAAVGLGPVTQQSALGQSLRVVIPLVADAGEDLAAECFKLASAEREADGIPQVIFGRVSLERSPSGAQLVVTHPRPVNDPVVRLTVQAGCDPGVRREYTLFMDPLPIDAPLLPAEPGARGDAEPPRQPATRPPARRADIVARGVGGTGTAKAPPEPRKAAPPKPRAAPRSATKRPPPKPSEQPRLKLATAPPQPSAEAGRGPASEARQAQAKQELANAIEAETVVLQQRIAELSATIEQLQQELKASEIADRATAEAAKAPPPPAPAPEPPPPAAWWEANWPLLAMIIGLPLLIAGGLLWKRRQEAAARGADWHAARVSAARTVAETAQREAPALRSAAAGVTQSRAEPVPPPARKTATAPPVSADIASALAVSELLHVTEEARVYVALGHPERAIDVLNEHLKRSPKSMPAAWLMLLDLYHANGRRPEFRRLAQDFHAHCNVQTPLWEGFSASRARDAGLEAFPHVLRQVVALWRKPEGRAYLERLLNDNRDGRRTGFPLGAYSDILMLLQISSAPPAIDIDSDLAKAGKLGLHESSRGPAGRRPA